MFMGEYRHTIDVKGRLIMPSKFRAKLGEQIVITKGYDGCISLYTIEGWTKIYEKLQAFPSTKKDARIYVRMLTSKATECDIDKQGRINIPDTLKQEGGITKECVIVGVADHIEIWSEERWDEFYEEGSKSFEDISENLIDFEI